MKPPSRTLTTLAFGFLLLDAALLLFGAIAFEAPRLFVPAAICAIAAGGVMLAWRWHRRNLAELNAAAPELKRELDELRELLRSHKP